MLYILLDESGDLGFSVNKRSSKYFIVSAIITDNKRRLEKIVKNVHRGLSRKYMKVGVLHAYQEKAVDRQRLLKRLNNLQCDIMAIILDKEKVHRKHHDAKSELYNSTTSILLDKLFKKQPNILSSPIILIASQRETNRFLNENFRKYIVDQVNDSYKVDIQVQISTPYAEKSLQVVDFVSWALYRKYENSDDSYYNIIKDKIIVESFIYP